MNNKTIVTITSVLAALLFVQMCVYFGLCSSEKKLLEKLNGVSGDLVSVNYEIDKVQSEITDIEGRTEN